MKSVAGFVLLVTANAYALPSLSVPEDVWQALSATERATVQKTHLVETVPAGSYGLLMDNQAVDRSDPGSNAGAALGSAVAQAAYIDRSINHGNYSAKTQLGIALVGMLVGSSFDRPAQAQYQFRYAVKMPDGSIAYHDKMSWDPFRHPSGACVMVPGIELAPNQKLCTITVEMLRSEYIKAKEDLSHETQKELLQTPPTGGLVTCKIGAVAPVVTTSEKCNLINGRVVND